ncbi:MAG: GntR family transcriptional regulator [Syntrophomonadaceae bacterium]|jgi:DNA-binding transcriptional regulator YhcF (GntR family)|nr:GntR family transcriptional regulator [Syntrophomonadaceae bacterium]
MKLDADTMKPIYVQIAEWLETEILAGNIGRDEKIYSQYQLADMFNINPATAGKGLSILAEEGILYKKRGLGMFVSPGAREGILRKRRDETLKQLILELLLEAQRLSIPENELTDMIRQMKNSLKGEMKS